jgi:hypothetical protein
MRNISLNLCVIVAILLCAALLNAAESSPLILFDEGHGQRLVIDKSGDLDLSKLAGIMRTTGVRVSRATGPLTDDALKDVAALVISGPFKTLQPNEIEAVGRFLKNGGKLAVMLHIGAPLDGLLTSLDIDFSTSVLHERRNVINKDLNFRVTDLSPHPLFSGINAFSAYGVWALRPGASTTGIARTSPEAWIDLNNDGTLSPGDAVGAFVVVVTGNLGKGRYVVFGDDAIFQNRFLDDDNRKLAVNLATWLTGH